MDEYLSGYQPQICKGNWSDVQLRGGPMTTLDHEPDDDDDGLQNTVSNLEALSRELESFFK